MELVDLASLNYGERKRQEDLLLNLLAFEPVRPLGAGIRNPKIGDEINGTLSVSSQRTTMGGNSGKRGKSELGGRVRPRESFFSEWSADFGH